MCGICGKLNFDPGNSVAPALLRAMADSIRHRGPDDEGYYASESIGLGFRRLSIIDLNTGHQPICNEDGTVWIVFNGEIYNYRELRELLKSKGHVFKSQSDTEVIVHLYEEYGESCLEMLRGMFAFAIWDDRQKVLMLARDRVGIKPLYYWLGDKSLIFASEVKAILTDPEVKAEVVPGMIDRFLTFYYVPGDETLFRNIFKLPPGSFLVVKNGKTQIKQYWDLQFSPRAQNFQDAQQQLLEMLKESLRLHMISDVPVGFLLSGGVDSTAMLGLTERNPGHPLSSYTLGFSEPGLADERPYARLAASLYGSEHHEMTITADQFADFMPKFAWHMEEPVCEPQAVALYYVSRLAKDFVKVLISGEGGDEAFAGYQTYRGVMWLERVKKLVKPFGGAISAGLSTLNQALGLRRLSKYGPLMQIPFEDYYYSRTTSPFSYFNTRTETLYANDFAESVDKRASVSAVKKYLTNGRADGYVNRMLYVDTKTSLPDDLLLKADKMTMANSIELRVPLLDHKILEFAASLPENFKVRGLTTKYIAKEALRDRVPKEILQRKKAGFPVPYETWLRRELKDWVHDIVLDGRTISRGYFKRSGVESLLAADSRTGGHSKEVLSLVALEMWHRQFIDGVQSRAQTEAESAVVAPAGD